MNAADGIAESEDRSARFRSKPRRHQKRKSALQSVPNTVPILRVEGLFRIASVPAGSVFEVVEN